MNMIYYVTLQLINSTVPLILDDFNLSLILIDCLIQANHPDQFLVKTRYLVFLRIPTLLLNGTWFLLHDKTVKNLPRIDGFKRVAEIFAGCQVKVYLMTNIFFYLWGAWTWRSCDRPLKPYSLFSNLFCCGRSPQSRKSRGTSCLRSFGSFCSRDSGYSHKPPVEGYCCLNFWRTAIEDTIPLDDGDGDAVPLLHQSLPLTLLFSSSLYLNYLQLSVHRH